MMTEDERRERAFYRVAWNIHHMWEECGTSDTRLLTEPIIAARHVTAGTSKNGGSYQEHVVPRLLICKECHRKFSEGATIEEVASFIEKFLKVVLISKDEQLRLDSKSHMNMKQRMPSDWSFENGGVFDRIREAGIEFDENI